MSRKNTSTRANKISMCAEFVRVLYLMFKKPRITSQEIAKTFGSSFVYCNYTKMKYWGLMFQEKQGLWHPTALAVDWLKGGISIPETIYYFNDQVIRTENQVHVWDVLNKEERDGFRNAMRMEIMWKTREVQHELF